MKETPFAVVAGRYIRTVFHLFVRTGGGERIKKYSLGN